MRRDRVAGHIAAGRCSSISDYRRKAISDGIIVHIFRIIRLPVYRGEVQCTPVFRRSLRDILQVHAAEIGVGSCGRNRPRIVLVASGFYGNRAGIQFQRAGETVLSRDFFGVRKQRKNGSQFLAVTADRNIFGVCFALLFGQLLPEHIREDKRIAVLLKTLLHLCGRLLICLHLIGFSDFKDAVAEVIADL